MVKKKILIPIMLIFLAVTACTVFLVISSSDSKSGNGGEVDDVQISENFNPVDGKNNEFRYDVTAKNNTGKDYYVRVKIGTSISDKQTKEKEWLDKHVNSKVWAYEKDGYFYLKEKLKGYDQTQPVLKDVIVGDTFLVKDINESVYLIKSDYVKARGSDSYKEAFENYEDK